ncbi:MAG: cytidylate kinase-like family protein [bacterium]
MENILLQYFDKPLKEKNASMPDGEGPVVTISREFGCPSKQIGILLTEALNKQSIQPRGAAKPRWKFINKEIIEEAARELKLLPSDMDYVLNSAEKGLFEDVLVSFTKPYVSNLRLKRTLQRVIRNVVSPGHIVLVGRGSSMILQGFPGALHIRLQAPLGWRVEGIQKNRGISTHEAVQLVHEIDQNRIRLMEFLLGKKFESSLFDTIFNCARLSNEEIVSSVLALMKLRQMI